MSDLDRLCLPILLLLTPHAVLKVMIYENENAFYP